MTATNHPIEAHDVGPISEFHFDAPQSGVVVLRGPMGSGKSVMLDAIAAASGSKTKPPVADGADRAEIRVGDVLLKVGKATRRTGELEYHVLAGRYSIADLIAPPFKDLSSRDSHAIRTIAQLSGSADESLFYDLVGGQEAFEDLCPADERGSLDVVALAGKIARGLQARARIEESKAEAADGKADGLSAGVREVDHSAEYNATALAEARDKAVRALAALEERAGDAAKRLEAARNAQDALSDAEAELAGPTVQEAHDRLSLAHDALRLAADAVERREEELRAAKANWAKIEQEAIQAEQTLVSAKNAASALDRFREIVAGASDVFPVPPEELESARAALEQARKAELEGAVIRKALAAKEESDDWRRKAAEHRKGAEQLRAAAAGTDEVLSDLVGTLESPLFVQRGKLVLRTDRGVESFWDLSDGERSEIACTVFAAAARRQAADQSQSCLLSLPQSFWEGLDWQGRKRIAELMRRLNVLAFTAESDKSEEQAGPLRAEVYEP